MSTEGPVIVLHPGDGQVRIAANPMSEAIALPHRLAPTLRTLEYGALNGDGKFMASHASSGTFGLRIRHKRLVVVSMQVTWERTTRAFSASAELASYWCERPLSWSAL